MLTGIEELACLYYRCLRCCKSCLYGKSLPVIAYDFYVLEFISFDLLLHLKQSEKGTETVQVTPLRRTLAFSP